MEWMQDANCNGTSTEDWFFDEEANEHVLEWRERQLMLAKMCSRCAVWDVCRAYSLGDEHGMFAGTTKNQRAKIRSELRIIGPDKARYMGSKVAQLIDEGYSLDVALKLQDIPDHPYFHDYDEYEYRG
jgi:hypothetical protein